MTSSWKTGNILREAEEEEEEEADEVEVAEAEVEVEDDEDVKRDEGQLQKGDVIRGFSLVSSPLSPTFS